MNWLNLNTQVLDSPEVIGGDPVERATWLFLLRYCIGQENGGRICNCREWNDRKWQQLVRVMQCEVFTESALWSWQGNDLVVKFYPSDKEDDVKTKRIKAAQNGRRGGRPPKTKEKPTSVSGDKTTPVILEKAEGERERERNVLLEKEPKGVERPPDDRAEPQKKTTRPPDDSPQEPRRRMNGKALLIAEAERTSAETSLPPDLDTAPFRDAWRDWCEHRIALAKRGKPWSAIAARNLLRQCADNGEEWAIAEIRQAISSGWQGLVWDQRRNPADVRSKPLVSGASKPLNRMENIEIHSEVL